MNKLSFIIKGIRYSDIFILMAYPTMGAFFAINSWNTDSAIRLLTFSIFNFIFFVHLFIYNDIFDARLNPKEPEQRKHHALKNSILTEKNAFCISIILAIISFIGFSFISFHLLIYILMIEILTAAYSSPGVLLKGVPVISTIVHFFGSSLYFIAGYSIFMPISPEAILPASYFGIVLSAGHFSNEIDDYSNDLSAGIKTNAIAFGQRAVFRAGIILFILSSLFFLYIATAYLKNIAYTIIASCLIIYWIITGWLYRNWKPGDKIRNFRMKYRLLYASLCIALILIRLAEQVF